MARLTPGVGSLLSRLGALLAIGVVAGVPSIASAQNGYPTVPMLSEATRSRYRRPLSRALVVLLSALLLPPVLASRSEADGGDRSVIHACVKVQQGTTRIVGANDRCGPSETAVHWNITGPQEPADPAGAAFLQVVDSQDKTVAPVVRVEFLNPIVAFKVGGLVFALKLIDDRLYGYGYPYFETGDCTGSPYIQRFPGMLPVTAVDQNYRVSVNTGLDLVFIRVYSYATHDTCVPVNFSLWVVPAISVLDLREQFTPPFRLQ